jgi:hypothetical protein
MRATSAAARLPIADILSSRALDVSALAAPAANKDPRPMMQSITALKCNWNGFIGMPPWHCASWTSALD